MESKPNPELFFNIRRVLSVFVFVCFLGFERPNSSVGFFARRLTARKTSDSKSGLTSTSEIELARTSNLPTAQAAWS